MKKYETLNRAEFRQFLFNAYLGKQKKLEDVIKQTPVFHGLLEPSHENEIFDTFNVSENEREGVHIIFASWSVESIYSDDDERLYVIFIRNNKLYCVEGHSNPGRGSFSRNQWKPEETSIEKIINSIFYDDVGANTFYAETDNSFNKELLEFICENIESSLTEELSMFNYFHDNY